MNRPARNSEHRLLVILVGIALSFGKIISSVSAEPESISESALQQIRALEREKAERSPVHRKLDSHFVYKLKQNRRQLLTSGIHFQPRIKFEPDGRVLVDIDAAVSDNLIAQIKQAGGDVVSSVPRFHSIRALVPLDQLETLAALADVKFIKRAVQAQVFAGSVTSEGDASHGADVARGAFGVTGAGIKVGVLSDSVDHLASSQTSGDLPTNVVVLPGQGGWGHGEGTAMLEIIHDLAPDAELYFATAAGSEAGFAQNILDLRSSGCDIIVDDVLYFDESPFQDGLVAQAVNSVTADGALYFSSAGNNGNLNGTTSTTWEGDFVNGGTFNLFDTNNEVIYTAQLHDFGTLTFNRVLTAYNLNQANTIVLFWADPLGASTNDYDLFVLNPSGTDVVDLSGEWQNGTQDPYESASCEANDRVIIVKYAGDDRFLHLQVMANGSARLNLSTSGNTFGHSAATNAFCVAAVNATTPFSNPFGASNPDGPFPDVFTGGMANPVEWFSSDGPRRVFFHADGSPITPDDFLSTGGAVRQKPDITAADGVANTVPGPFQPLFYGTSAAAPHAAAIAALLKSYNRALNGDQIRAALIHSALDINDPGVDRDSGAGIVMAETSLQYLRLLIPVIETICLTNNTAVLSWSALTNQMYQVQYTTNLAEPNWINLGDAVNATNAVVTTFDESLTDPQRFYRIMILP